MASSRTLTYRMSRDETRPGTRTSSHNLQEPLPQIDASATTISQDSDRAGALERSARNFSRPKENSEVQVLLKCRKLRRPWHAWISAAAATTITGITTFYWFASIPRDLHAKQFNVDRLHHKLP